MNRHRVATLLGALAVLAFAVAGCSVVHNNGTNHRIGSSPYTKGSGHVASVDRTLASFHAVTVENGLVVMLKHGTSDTAKVSADDNLTSMIKTDVSGGTLRVWVDGSLETNNELMVNVTAATDVDTWVVDGGSTLDTEDVNLANTPVQATVTSGSTMRGGGKAGTLNLHVSTGATADLQNLTVQSATVAVDTGATAYVLAADSIDGTCTLGSTLHVLGKPARSSVSADTSSTLKFE